MAGLIERGLYQTWGPPGCAKTTWIAHRVEEVVDTDGPHSVMIVSLTRAAAAEIAKRHLPIPREAIGTLHAHCYRALERPTLTEDHMQTWNDAFPVYRMDRYVETSDDFGRPVVQPGDLLAQHYHSLRARMIPRTIWPPTVLAFTEAWERFKREQELLDFTDLIEIALTDVEAAPGRPAVIFADEAQDLCRLELALLKKWGKAARALVLVGDAWQNLFGWRGTEADLFLADPAPDGHRRLLTQSYRVPRAVHAQAMQWAAQLSTFQPIVYYPRRDVTTGQPVEGDVRTLATSYRYPEALLPQLEAWTAAGQTVMCLASCGYLLDPLKACLRQAGLPFHNPYRPTRADWNPLHPRKGSASERLLAFLRPNRSVWAHDARFWTVGDLQAWVDPLQAEAVCLRGKKKAISEADAEQSAWEHLEQWLQPEAAQAALHLSLDWFAQHLLPMKRKAFEFPLAVARQRGGAMLRETPRLTIGTVHCSPPDEPILTVNRGYVPISELILEFDRLLGMNNLNTIVKGKTNRQGGYECLRSVRRHHGILIEIKTDTTRTRVTPDHFLKVRFSESSANQWCVYLMRKNQWWRIGVTQTHRRPYRSGGLHGRLASERANAAWILAHCQTLEEAQHIELSLSIRYGIPTIIFLANDKQKIRRWTDASLAALHDSLIDVATVGAHRLLSDFGLLVEYPLFERRDHRTQTSFVRDGYWFETVSANLVPTLMEVQLYVEGKRSPKSTKFTVKKEFYDGEVYGLHVPPHEHYVSGGIVVHNSVKGGEGSHVVVFPDLSRAGMQEWLGPRAQRDSVVRLFYVAFTRARDTLCLATPGGALAVRWGGNDVECHP